MQGKDILGLGRKITIDLPNQTVNGAAFDIDPGDKKMLIEGLDMIAQTLIHKAEIDMFFACDKIKNSWKY